MKIRKLTAYSKSSPHPLNRIRFLPEIRLFGLWLKDCGFECQQEILVTCEPGRLVITPTGDPPVPEFNPDFFRRGRVPVSKEKRVYGEDKGKLSDA